MNEAKLAAKRFKPAIERPDHCRDCSAQADTAAELQALVSANLQRATRLRQSILQKAFTGNL